MCESEGKSNQEVAPGLLRYFASRNSGTVAPVLIVAAALSLCLASLALALDFPTLTGRVVDQAGVMSAASRTDVEMKSKNFEDKSGIQLVVATVKSLQGNDIETYANQLFRFWNSVRRRRTTACYCSWRQASTKSASRSAMVSKVR